MKNPRVAAAVSVIAIALMGSSMLFSSETPSGAVMTLQWIFLVGSTIGLIGSLAQIANQR